MAGNVLNTPDYFGDAWNRTLLNYANSAEGLRVRLEARGWKPTTKFTVKPTGAGRMTSVKEETWVSPDGETTIVGPDALEQAIQYSQENPVDDASENMLNNLMVGGAGLWRGIGNGGLLLAQEWLPKLSFSATSTAGKGLGATASTSALAGDAALATAFTIPTVMDISQNGFNPVNATELGLSMLPIAGEIPSMWRSFRSRWTPYGFRVGNNAYGFNFGQLNSGMPISKTSLWQLQDLPGYLIKSLFKGSPLEKQLSKNGTLSLKLLQAYVGRNDVPSIDKELLGRVLQNHAGETHIDYNTLRLEVLGMIPLYNIKLDPDPSFTRTSLYTYGMGKKGLGFELVNEMTYMDYPFKGWKYDNPSLAKARTFTFESSGIKGDNRHFVGDPIGHSRTYTTVDEPDILHVMESLSDWALHPEILSDKQAEHFLSVYERRKQSLLKSVQDFNNLIDSGIGIGGLPLSRYDINAIVDARADKLILLERLEDTYKRITHPNVLEPYMQKTYLNRLLQENLKYAAENGLTKMRYPTPETAAKIEGYEKGSGFLDLNMLLEYDNLCRELEKVFLENNATTTSRRMDLVLTNPKAAELNGKITSMQPYMQRNVRYSPEHQTILKKYADFPKQFLKLFGKQSQIRIVTDAKGNTWYEVDVPLNYLNGTAEMLFKKGGKVKLISKKKYGSQRH